jgi:aspartyl-tRNA(Asn)/glutamyl-tRNA(Gln) amidotransferase subunit A
MNAALSSNYPAHFSSAAAARDRAEAASSAINGVISLIDPAAAGAIPAGRAPVLVKDCIDVAGMRTSHGSAVHAADPPASGDAEVVRRLRLAGAAVIGKAHLTEFCFGATGENAHFGNARNPWDAARITGGSSSGSAACVAAGVTRVAIGTDTGGSVRVPAALCGVVGLRPTFGRVSNHGCLDVSSTCDTIGPIGATVAETAWLFDAIAGFDPRDPHALPDGPPALPKVADGITGLRIGIARPFFFEDADPAVLSAVEAATRVLERFGAILQDIALGDVGERRAQNAIRFVAADVADARRAVYERHRDRIGAEFARRIETGMAVSGTEYAASIRSLWRLRHALRTHFLDGIAAIITPTTPVTAPLWADASDMIATTRTVARFTYDIGAAGVPALSVPCGFDADGLPIGLQIIAPWGDEATLFRIGHAFEQATEHHRRRAAVVAE